MKLSIVILNYNVRYFLELCLKSIELAIKNIDTEVIVVDNNSSDESCTMVKQLFPWVTLIENKTNFGFSKGNNIGVSHTKGEYLCILNPDTVVAEDTFVKILEFAVSKDNLGCIGCQFIDGSGKFLPESKRCVPTPKVALQKLFGIPKNYYNNQLDEDAIGKTSVLTGAFMFLKRQIYIEANGFDEAYFMYGEDIDLSYSVLKLGYQNYYYGNTTIIHFKGESTLKDAVYAKRFYGAMVIFYKKHFKSNVLVSSSVSYGLHLFSKFKKTKKITAIIRAQSYVFSNNIPAGLKPLLPQPIHLITGHSVCNDNALVVFDANVLSFKTIISKMKSITKFGNYSFRIIPKKSAFYIGSESNFNKGEVIQF